MGGRTLRPSPDLIELLAEVGKRVESAVDLFRSASAVRLLGDSRVDVGEVQTSSPRCRRGRCASNGGSTPRSTWSRPQLLKSLGRACGASATTSSPSNTTACALRRPRWP